MQPRETTLLTGATGFVGGQLLVRLLRREGRHLTCPVRGASAEEAQARGQAILFQLLGRRPTAEEASRVEWIRANIEERRLGLDTRTWWRLARQMREIFHCAASVRFDIELAEAQRINVDGVRHLLELASDAGEGFRRFHHVSTAYVAGVTRGRVRANFLPADRARNFRNNYERTKARAERLLRDQDRVPVTIYRPSIVAGDTMTGRTTSWNVLYVPMQKVAVGQMPYLRCGGRALVDTVGIDFVADGILALAERPAPHATAYHLVAGRHAFDVCDFIAASVAGARAGGSRAATRAVSPASWWIRTRSLMLLAHAPRFMGGARRLGRMAMRGVRSFDPYAPYTSVNVEFDADLEQGWLEANGITMPASASYLRTIVGYALANDFGQEKPTEETARPERQARTRRERSTAKLIQRPASPFA